MDTMEEDRDEVGNWLKSGGGRGRGLVVLLLFLLSFFLLFLVPGFFPFLLRARDVVPQRFESKEIQIEMLSIDSFYDAEKEKENR